MKLTMHRGDTLEIRLALFDADGVTPFSLVGAKVWSTLKRALSDTDVLAVSRVDSAGVSVPSGGSVTVTDAANGRVTIRHASAATDAFETGYLDLYYDVQVRDSLSRVFTVDHGTVSVVPDVTRTAV